MNNPRDNYDLALAFLQIFDVVLNVSQVSNDVLLKELQKQNEEYLGKIIKQNEEIKKQNEEILVRLRGE